MHYQTFQPHPDLNPLIKCYWTLEVPREGSSGKQRIVPDGCLEMAFILGDDIKRYTSANDFILQPRAMVLGQTIEPFFIEPVGYVNTFAVRFYPYGFANFVRVPIKELVNKETPINELFETKEADLLTEKIVAAKDTPDRIDVIEKFLLKQLQTPSTINSTVKATVDVLLSAKGSASLNALLNGDLSRRRQLERKFQKQVGMSPKQLAKVIRLQTALAMLLNQEPGNLTNIAYESDYYDQAHFIKDFKEFTGTTPKHFLRDNTLALSSLFYGE